MLSRSQRFLKEIDKIINKHLSNPDFSVSDLSKLLEISESTLRRKIHKIAYISPNQYIRKIRLTKAKQLINKDIGTISEIADMVGFKNKSYFAKCFFEYFKIRPNELRKNNIFQFKLN